MASIKDIARHARVSVGTVSNVINTPSRVEEKTRQRVLAAIDKYSYVPSDAARRMRLGAKKGGTKRKTSNIGVLLFARGYSKFSHPNHYEFLEAVDDEIIKQDYNMAFLYTTDQLLDNPRLVGRITEDNIDGLIISGGISPEENDILQKIQRQVKCIVHSGASPDNRFDFIGSDLERGAYDAVKYLNGLGHTRIGFINRNPADPEEPRFVGYSRALKDLGLPYDASIVEGSAWKPDQLQAGYEYMKTIMERAQPLPEAVFATGDLLAIGAIKAIHEKGIKIPDDISVMGLDNLRESRVTTPALTTMDLRRDEMARTTVRRLLERIENPEADIIRIILPPKLVIRDSSRPIQK